jgi:hypothetical protein
MLKEREIRDQLVGYLTGLIPLQQLASWVYDVTWDMDAATDLRTQEFAYAVLGRLAEHSSAGYPEASLKTELRQLASNIIVMQDRPAVQGRSHVQVLSTSKVPVAL